MKRLTYVQPFLFAVFPILSLFAANVGLVRPGEVMLPAAIVLAAAGLTFLLAARLLKDAEGGALVVSVFWLLFFSFGRLLTFLGGSGGGHEAILFLACLGIFGGTVALAIKQRGHLGNLATIMNVVGAALVIMPLLTIIPALARGKSIAGPPPIATATTSATATATAADPVSEQATPSPVAEDTTTSTPQPVPYKPDIYYIILDGYARSDVLKELYGVDNSAFLAGLEQRGFYIAEESRANYCQTYLSLASSLNMTYLNEVAAATGEDSDDRRPLQDRVRQNEVVRLLKEQGYTYAAFSTGYAEGELNNADIYLTAPWSLSQFQSGLVGSTPISPTIALQYEMHRERLLYAFDHVPDMADVEGPVFVFAHITAPHPPFVFGANGEKTTPNREFTFSDGSHFVGEASRPEYVAGYQAQVSYITTRAAAMVEAILARSAEPPVIILQSDHGPGSQLDWYSAENSNLTERLSILNAYHLPGGADARLYESITPVNTFRLIFDHYFGAGYGLLEDRSYFSTWPTPYRFIYVPSR